jgi:hypothetical protein
VPLQGDETPLNPPDVEVEELGRELTGDQAEGDQVAFFREDEVATLGQGLSDVEVYEGELEAGVNDDMPGEPVAENLELLTEQELREGETDNPDVAAEEGLTYVPPIDPPVIPDPDDPQGVQVAAGFGTTALDEPFDADHHSEILSNDDEFAERVREALRADSMTSMYAESLAIGTRDGTVAVRGVVDDIDDTDNVVEVIGRVTGVVEVRDELEVRGVTD